MERLLPERRSPLARYLDPAALATPLAAEEAVRRTVARSLSTLAAAIAAALGATKPSQGPLADNAAQVAGALREAWDFIAEASGPPASDAEQLRLTSTLHALDEASRLAEVASEAGGLKPPSGDADSHAARACAKAMTHAVSIADGVLVPEGRAPPTGGAALGDLERCAHQLADLQKAHRSEVLGSVAGGTLGADEAAARIDVMRRLEALARHASLCARHLVAT